MGHFPALTVWQPWASLIVEGFKPYEFRRWPAHRALVGERIAIHAGARRVYPREVAELILALSDPATAPLTGLRPREEALAFLERVHTSPASLPLSSILGTAILGTPVRSDRLAVELGIELFNDSNRRLEFNYAWPLTEIRRLEPFIPARGKQGIWRWEEAEPANVCESCGRATIRGHCEACARDRAAGEEFADRHGMPWEAS